MITKKNYGITENFPVWSIENAFFVFFYFENFQKVAYLRNCEILS